MCEGGGGGGGGLLTVQNASCIVYANVLLCIDKYLLRDVFCIPIQSHYQLQSGLYCSPLRVNRPTIPNAAVVFPPLLMSLNIV